MRASSTWVTSCAPGRVVRCSGASGRPRAPRGGGPARAARRGAGRGCGRACSCTSGCGRAGTARPWPGAGRPRSPGVAPGTAGRCRGPSARASRAPRGSVANSGLRVLDGCAPASKRAKSRLSAASHGRLPVALRTTSGASIATRQSPATYGARAAPIASSVSAALTRHQVPAVVEDGEAGGLAIPPREVDADEVHGGTLTDPTHPPSRHILCRVTTPLTRRVGTSCAGSPPQPAGSACWVSGGRGRAWWRSSAVRRVMALTLPSGHALDKGSCISVRAAGPWSPRW